MPSQEPTPAAAEPTGKRAGRKTVFVTGAAHGLVDKAARKLRLSNTDYVSACVEYFASNGLDPTSVETKGLISVQARVGQADMNGRRYTADVGNRLVAIIRSFESQLYTMLHAQQTNTFTYLERIEHTIIDHLLGLEAQVFTPMFERVTRLGVENHIVRRLTEIVLLQVGDEKVKSSDIKASADNYDESVDKQFIEEIRKHLEVSKKLKPVPAAKPPVTSIPKTTDTKATQPTPPPTPMPKPG